MYTHTLLQPLDLRSNIHDAEENNSQTNTGVTEEEEEKNDIEDDANNDMWQQKHEHELSNSQSTNTFFSTHDDLNSSQDHSSSLFDPIIPTYNLVQLFQQYDAMIHPTHNKQQQQQSTADNSSSSSTATSTSTSASACPQPCRPISLTLESLSSDFIRWSSLHTQLMRRNEDISIAANLGLQSVTQSEQQIVALQQNIDELENKNRLLQQQLEDANERYEALSRITAAAAANTNINATHSLHKSNSFRFQSFPSSSNSTTSLSASSSPIPDDDMNVEAIFEFMRRQIIESNKMSQQRKLSTDSGHNISTDSNTSISSDDSSSASTSVTSDNSLRHQLTSMSPMTLLRTYKQMQLEQQKAMNSRIRQLETTIEGHTHTYIYFATITPPFFAIAISQRILKGWKYQMFDVLSLKAIRRSRTYFFFLS